MCKISQTIFQLLRVGLLALTIHSFYKQDMVVHLIKLSRKIKRTEADSGAVRDVSINNRSYGIYSVGTDKPRFKVKLVVAGCKESCIKVK